MQSRSLSRLLAVSGVIWRILLSIATLSGLGLWTAWPRIEVSRDTFTNPQLPLTELFLIKNESPYQITDVVPACEALQINANQISAKRISVVNPFDIVGHLASGKPTDATCRLDVLFARPQTYGTLAISVNVSYTIPWINLRRCTSSTFLGTKAAGDRYIWKYTGGGECSPTNLPK